MITGCETDQLAPDAVADGRMAFVTSLFTGAEQHEHFSQLAKIFPNRVIAASSAPFSFPRGPKVSMPNSYVFHGQKRSTGGFLEETDTVSLLVLANGAIVYERHWLTGGTDTHWMSMSVAKSFVSALIGIAVTEGSIKSIEEPVTDYVPALAGSAYEGVSIKHLLQMSSGARWNENYSDPESDIMRFVHAFGTGASLDDFAATLVRAREPGTYHYYNSMDTQVLAMALSQAIGQSISAYAETKLWQPLGMEKDAYWITDDQGVEFAVGGLQMVARDYAKLGQLYLNQGRWQGKQIVPASWVRDSVTPDAPHLLPGVDPEYPVGYGYQWWVPEGDDGEFCAIGVYNQFIYVDPSKQLVIVKLSANRGYGLTDDDSSWRELESFALFRAIGDSVHEEIR